MAKKPTVTTIASGYASTTTLNNNFEALREGFDNTLSLDGSTPNAMQADLDMDGNDILDAGSIIVGGQDLLAATQANLSAAAVAQADAEAAVTAAETSETNAATSAASASTSASNAATSASQAASSALAASGSATASATSALAAESAETGAETAETNAASSAAAALASKTAASTSETNAAASEAASSTSETNAAASAAAASTSETNAATSETNAANSATASASSATASAASATAASASEASVEADRLSAQAAATSASASEVAAAASESNAASSETAAASSASSASTSASSAASSASSASASADAALAALDNFDDRYLGQKASDPTLDNDGNALVAGALYFNTSDEIMKVFDGSLWVAAYASLSGAMFGANNLSDVSSASDSRANLGLGTGDSPTFAGLTTTGNVSFGDNDKAIFGAGSDLQIYHDGSHSRIEDEGQGGLILQGSAGVYIQGQNDENIIIGNEDGSVQIYHNNAEKLATTSTGIDVTGTVTADGLTSVLSGDTQGKFSGWSVVGINTASGAIELGQVSEYQGVISYSADANTRFIFDNTYGSAASTFEFRSNTSATPKTHMKITGGGDISFYEDTGTTPKFFWDASAESLGIGTSPSTALHVSTPTTTKSVVETTGTSSDALIEFTRGQGSGNTWSVGLDQSNSSALSFAYLANGSPSLTSHNKMTIDSSGNVGIGTTSPSAKVMSNVNTFTDADKIAFKGYNNQAVGVYANFQNATTGTGFADGFRLGIDDSENAQIMNGESTAMIFATSATERMRIDSSGNLLVGKTSDDGGATQGAEVKGNGFVNFTKSNDNVLNLNRLSSDGAIATFRKNGSTVGSIQSRAGVVSTIILDPRTAGAGLTGAGDGSSNRHIVGTNESGAEVDGGVNLGKSGVRFKDAYFSGTVNAANFNTTSDATLKTNVETLTGSLDAVNALRGVSFDWIENGGSEIGFIAQEVEEVLPEVVSTNDQGIKSVKYGNMVAVLVEALKEQQLRIEALEAKLEG